MWNEKEDQFVCLICGESFGYLEDDINKHILTHGNSLERLLSLDKKNTGLTELQKELLAMISNKKTNKEISETFNCAESTVRNMKLSLRERAKQARAYLAIIDLVEDEGIMAKPKIKSFPIKEEKRKALLPRFARLFEPNKEYSEKEVKKIINSIYEDDSLIRRYLVHYGYMNRNKDGSKYYRIFKENDMKDVNRKELINEYKQQDIEMGIIKISNKENGYSYVDVCNNLYKPFEGIKFQLNLGRFKCKNLQKDWTNFGEEGFSFEVVEKLKTKKDDSEKRKNDELKELLELWIESNKDSIKLY